MPARNRTKVETTPTSGWYKRNYTPKYYGTAYSGVWHSCADVTGNFPNDNPFNKGEQHRSVASLDGFEPRYDNQGNPAMEYSSYPCPNFARSIPAYTSVFPSLTTSEKQGLVTELMALTNPSQAHISVPQFVGELKDIPSLIYEWGGSLLRRIAKGYISWRWAVNPMINDIRRMVDFQSAVEKRLNELRNLKSGKSLKRRQGLTSSTVTLPEGSEYWLHTSAAIVTGKDTKSYSSRVWGSMRYSLTEDTVLPETDASLRKYAYDLTFGINSAGLLAALWELTPWSWFADWFGNVGDWLAATNNSIPLARSSACLMRTITAKNSTRIINKPSWMTVTGQIYEMAVSKVRLVEPALPAFVAARPALGAGQWSILAALASLKAERVRKDPIIRVWVSGPKTG